MTALSSERRNIDGAVAQLFTPDDARRVQALRALFVEQLDFTKASGAIQVAPPHLQGRGRSSSARLIAQRDGVTVVFATPEGDRVLSAAVVRGLYQSSAKTLGDVLLVCSTGDSRHWQFIYPRQQDGREVLRRLSVQQGQPRYTFVQQLSELVPNSANLGIKTALEQLYDVEAVTKRFFSEYRRTFEAVMASVVGLPDDEERRLFCQTLFNRLMFLYFLQRKGCLTFNGSADYLNALWHDHTKVQPAEGTCYRTRLRPLFFLALNNERSEDFTMAQRVLEAQIGRVPFLNGGLFAEDDLDRRPGVDVPDEAIRRILTDLFDRFNFTITESTPYDVEVAVDPEMLGKVFEELVTGRHETGSYYTPRPIVSFMGKEALKGYLAHALPAESPEAIERFVDEHSAADLRDPERALEALKRVRGCDPACGSGAYLLGMLQELLELRRCLFAEHRIGPEDVYNRKLEIIQDNLYGVDIDPFAVNIARLRLWLSLIVDYAGATPPPLPNLDFKIEQGDSLLAPSPEGVGQLGLRDALIPEFRAAKARYARAHGEEKRVEREYIERLQADIALATHPGKGQGAGFDWAVAFAEVFGEGGFDIILANPPYVRQELIKDLKPALKQVFPEVYNGTADLYCYFYARALQLLRSGGMLAFISSNKWFRATYGTTLRKLVATTCSVVSITDFGDLPVFVAASAYPMIFIAQKGIANARSTIFTQVTSLQPPYPDLLAITKSTGHALPSNAFSGANWMLSDAASVTRLGRMESGGIPLGGYVNGQIYRGVVTGRNRAFWIDDDERRSIIKQDPNSAALIKPLLVGDNVRRWRIDAEDRWLLFTRRGINIEHYPGAKDHLERFRGQLEPKPKNWPDDKEWSGRKPGNYKWYEIQDEVAYHTVFMGPKIVFPDLALSPRFALDKSNAYVDCTLNAIPVDDLYLLGVLNSRSVAWFLAEKTAKVRGGYLRFKPQYVENIPIPSAAPADRETIASLVEQCLKASGAGPAVAEWEAEINERVAFLFGLSDGDPHDTTIDDAAEEVSL